MSTVQPESSSRKRRRLQYSLASLTLLILVVSVVMSYVPVKLRQKEAVDEVRRLGGSVRYEFQQKRGGSWNIPGQTFFSTVTVVNLSRTGVTDIELEHLTKQFTQVRYLRLSGTPVTDAGLGNLGRLKQLEWLDLEHAQITDAGLEHLEGLGQLRGLSLANTRITDAGLEHLKGLTRLRTLGLPYTKVTDEGVARLQSALPKCNIIY
jgi:hypothetical protein